MDVKKSAWFQGGWTSYDNIAVGKTDSWSHDKDIVGNLYFFREIMLKIFYLNWNSNPRPPAFCKSVFNLHTIQIYHNIKIPLFYVVFIDSATFTVTYI